MSGLKPSSSHSVSLYGLTEKMLSSNGNLLFGYWGAGLSYIVLIP